MIDQQYQVNQYDVNTILNWVRSDDIAIPEIQRPFVWNKTQVRNLLDSLYRGYPVGYLIAWRNPKIKMKDGTVSEGKKILIDGQQRVTALSAAILGKEIVNKNYKKEKIVIAFRPIGLNGPEFEVINPAIEKDATWISDISPIVSPEFSISIVKVIEEYCTDNPNVNKKDVEDNIFKLQQISNKIIGFIELQPDLDLKTVGVIFERVNSAGKPLNQADFAMSKIAVNGDTGSNLRKLIDYFCHLAKTPEFYDDLKNMNDDFIKTGFLQKISWSQNKNDDLYEPEYSDLLRVAFTSEFNRGKMSDLVSLLSGRNFETREFKSEIQDETFARLEKSVLKFTNEMNFKKFTMIIKAAGFINSKFIQSRNALNFAYIVYLKLKECNLESSIIERSVKKWLVMSLLTGRYSASPESTFDSDVKNITKNFTEHLKFIEDSELSDAFWNVALLSELEKSNINSSFLSVFFASQVKDNDKGFLSKDMSVREIIDGRGDIHHIFPKAYLKTKFKSKKDYNQISNLVYTQSEINGSIKDKDPHKYFGDVLKQCDGGELKYGGIADLNNLDENMKQNCIPTSVYEMTIDDYPKFLNQRKKLMAEKIKNYYKNL